MKKFKKALLVSLVLVVTFGLTACSKSKDYTAHVFFWNYADPFVGEIRTNLEKEFKEAGIEYKFYDGANNQSKQNEQIETAISSGASILVLNLVEAETGETVIKKAKDANIPTVFFNRQPPHEIFKDQEEAVLMDGDVVGGAKVQGELIANYLLKDYDKYAKEDGVIDYIMIRAELSHDAATARTKYSVERANEVLKEAGKPELRRHASAPSDLLADDWSAAKGKDAMSTILSTLSDPSSIDLVIGNNDGIAEGVVSALNDKDYNKGDDAKFIPVFGYDATDSGKDLIANHKLAGTVLQDAKQNANVITMMVKNKRDGKEFIEGTDLKYDGDFKRIVIKDVAYDPAVHK